MTMRLMFTNEDARASSIGLSLPVTRGVIACHFLDGATEAVRNRLDSNTPGTITGSPSWGDGFGTFTGNTTYVSTAIADLSLTDVSMIVVAKSTAAFSASASRPVLAGSYGAISADLYTACINITGTPSSAPAATVAATASRNNSSVPANVTASITVADMSAWTILGMSVAGAGGANALKIYDLTNGASASTTMSTARLPHPTRLFQIGATSSSLVGGNTSVAAYILGNVVWTQAEFEKLAAGLRRRVDAYHSIAA